MITSTSSSQVKHVVQLQKKAKARKENREFVVEGIKMVFEAPKDRIVRVYASETFVAANGTALSGLPGGFELVETVSDPVFSQMSDTKTPQGILAVVKMADYKLEDILKGIPLVIAVENIQDPGNLGTIIRMGEGAGVSGVLMSPNTVDIYNPKVIRSTMGSIYRVPFLYAEDFDVALLKMQQSGVSLYAASLEGKATYTQPNYQNPSAFLIGNEGNGLTDKTSALADCLIRIPMHGSVESLNAAIACTILTYEATRQRDLSS